MKILWFTNTPSLATKKISNSSVAGQSWIEAMERLIVLEENIELGLAFHWKTDRINDFTMEGSSTRYYMIPKKPFSKLLRYLRRMFCMPTYSKSHIDYMQVVEDFKPDIVHFFGTETSFPLIIDQLKMPSVIWFQGNLTVYHTKWKSGFPLWKTFVHENIKSILNGQSDFHYYKLYKKYVKREKKVFKMAKNFTGRTDWDRRLVSVMAPKANYFHCEEVLREAFSKREWKPWDSRKDKFIIVTTIRSNSYKGVETIFDTISKIVPLIDSEVEWRVIGLPDDSVFIKRIPNKRKSHKKYIKFLGFRSGPDLVEELLNANVYVHPTHIDNSPNSICEAMMIGMPIVGTNVGGIPSIC